MKKIALLLIVLLSIQLCACGGEKKLNISEEKALEVLSELVPASYDINVMFFGVGLPREDQNEYDTTKYLPVDIGKSAYSSISAMKNAAEQIYSGNYLDSIYVIMFEGTKSSESDGLLDNDMSARYKEIDGSLCIDGAFKPYNILGKLTVASIAGIVERTADYVCVEAKCIDEDGNELNKRFFLTLENEVWLLDGPTY